jgi:hypothetical protein
MNYYFLKFINTRLTDYKFILPITSLAFSGSIYSFYLNYNKFSGNNSKYNKYNIDKSK